MRGLPKVGPAAFAVGVLLVSCTGNLPGNEVGTPARGASALTGSGSSPIKNVIVIVQENRSFDDFFATFPNAEGTTQGLMKTSSGDMYVPLQPVDLKESCDFKHSYQNYLTDLDGGKMDGFDDEGANGKCNQKKSIAPYQYVKPKQIAPYWDMAKEYVLGDQMFQTQGSDSFTAHQDLVAGATIFDTAGDESLVDLPTKTPWGCDAPARTRTSYLLSTTSGLQYKRNQGPFPCMSYETMRDLLDGAGVSWKYYSPPIQGGTGGIWNAFEAIKAVRYGPEWGVNVTDSDTAIFSDIAYGQLPAVSWVIPDQENSDHPESKSDTGPSWVASIVNAVGESQYWNTSAIVVVWDDWGGFYDHVPPAFYDQYGGLGFRVPLIVVSPYALGGGTQNYVSHTQYEFGSILKFIEDTFALGSLGKTDERATSIGDCFNLYQAPRPFSAIPSKYGKAFFLRQRPSYKPVDTQ
ncbi:MAG TPA: alkaline phosphatase family protein [Candidatus Cybelea sp.]|nr:alkaline phosphatase family protein [Candidatus Cybelea sp.]